MTNEASICHRAFAAMVVTKFCKEMQRAGGKVQIELYIIDLSVKDSADSLIVVRKAQVYIIKEDQTPLLNNLKS